MFFFSSDFCYFTFFFGIGRVTKEVVVGYRMVEAVGCRVVGVLSVIVNGVY